MKIKYKLDGKKYSKQKKKSNTSTPTVPPSKAH